LEIHALEKELKETNKLIAYLQGILSSEKKLIGVIKEELTEIRNKYGIDRRSVIQGEVDEIKVNLEVMVTAEDVLVTLSKEGYIKRTSLLSFTRSGGEIESTGLKEGDQLRFHMEVNTIESLLIFTQKGQYYLLPVHQIPEYKWKETGTAIVNVIPIPKDDRIVTIMPVKDFEAPNRSLVFITRKGQVKRTELKEYYTNRSIGIVACKLGEQDEVVRVLLSDSTNDLLLVTKQGMSIRFKEIEVNSMGRVSAGVRGIQLKEDDEIIAAEWVNGDEGEIMVISDLGYAKRSFLFDYPVQGRGGKGIITFEFKEGKRVKPNGNALIGMLVCKDAYMVNLLLSSGKQTAFSTDNTPIEDRKSFGKQMVSLEKNEMVIEVLNIRNNT
jgi:topoisomerase-4 subunit A